MKSQDDKQWINELSDDEVKSLLNMKIKDIHLLKTIYMTGGENSSFSQTFKNAAVTENERLNLITSRCYSILRARNIMGGIR